MSPVSVAQVWVLWDACSSACRCLSPDHPHPDVLILATPDVDLHPCEPAMATLLRRDKPDGRPRAA